MGMLLGYFVFAVASIFVDCHVVVWKAMYKSSAAATVVSINSCVLSASSQDYIQNNVVVAT